MTRRTAKRTERPALSEALIVRAAIDLVEREGATALTMRKVAAELGVGTMSLYNHVPDRDSLVDGIARVVLCDLDVPTHPSGDWKADARALVAGFRAAAGRTPRTMHLVLTSKLDLGAQWWHTAEWALARLAEAGFDPDTSVRALRALMAFAFGSEIMHYGAVRIPDWTPGSTLHALETDPDGYPHVVAAADDLLRMDLRPDFDIGLEILLTALDDLIPRG